MGGLGERLDNIRLRVRVPGTQIQAELRNRKDVTLSFGESGYEFLNERTLEQYLASLARLLYVGWVREYRAAISETSIVIPEPETSQDRDFLEARAELEAVGRSSDGRIVITVVGMQDPQVRITRGTLRELTEDQFVARTKEAVVALAEDYQAKIRALKVRFFT